MVDESKAYLLIDAAPDWRERLARLLEREGCRVEAVGDVAAGLSSLRGAHVDCVVLDPNGQAADGVRTLLREVEELGRDVVLLGVEGAAAEPLVGVGGVCIPKPLPRPREMLQRLGVRSAPVAAAPTPPGSAVGGTDSKELHLLRERCKDLEARLAEQVESFDDLRESFNQELSRMMNIVSNIMDGILFTDAVGSIRLLNPVAEEMLGLRAFVAVGQTLDDLEESNELLDEIRATCDQRPDWRETSKTVEVHRDDQDLAYIKMRIGRVVDFRGEFAGTLIQLEDVTAEYKTDQLKNQYLSIVAHELRTPLTGIKTFSTMMAKGVLGGLNERQARVVDSIREQSLRLEHQIDKLVNLGHLDSNDVGQDLEPFDINELVTQASVPFQQVAAEKRITLVVDTGAAPGAMVEADRSAIRRAVQALVENAVKFTPDGGHVEVAVRQRDGQLEVAVSDDGVGIDPRYHRRIFEKFFQVEDPLTRHHGGSGLGLFFVKSIVEAHRSEVTVRSELGRGASFSFLLRSHEAETADETLATTPQTTAGTEDD
ncbi:MAG: PAS domain-containing protein [Planctomycetes bacterium]|nr:PAS domain-containing protein [Planctomycetota bacterium]